MGNKANRLAPRVQPKKAPLSADTMNRMVALYNGGQWEELEAAARDATRHHPEHFFGWKALGKALLKLGRMADAIEPLTRVTKITPNDPDPHNDLAIAFQHLGRRDEAVASYRRLLKLKPGSAQTHDTLGALLCELARFNEAEIEFRLALAINPRFIEAHINLGFAAGTLGRWDEAEASYRLVLALDPNFAEAHRRLGDLLSRIRSRNTEAIPFLERAIALNPVDVGSVITLGNVLMTNGQLEESRVMFRRAQQIQPLITWPSIKPKPDFSVLLLDAPGAGSTPVNYLAGHSAYEANFVGVLPDFSYDIELLRAKADVVVNMIADADNGHEVLPLALDLADRIARPIVNHPRKIMGTDRESIARKLAAIPLCRIPKTLRLTASEMNGNQLQEHIAQLALPVLIRCAGTHGGDDFEKVDDLGAISEFVTRHPEATFYVSEFVDYRAADGYYRKYRLICIDGQILPYHLAIHDHWMVHHFRTDMANQAWMREEEEAFLKEPHNVFNAEHFAAFHQMAAAIGLDYCGIDCSLDRDGNIVVFEANATMLVHDEKNPPFLYKNPYIAKIKEAFDAMLTKMAAKGLS